MSNDTEADVSPVNEELMRRIAQAVEAVQFKGGVRQLPPLPADLPDVAAKVGQELIQLGFEKRHAADFQRLCRFVALYQAGCLRKGLLLAGPCGVGKSVFLRAFGLLCNVARKDCHSLWRAARAEEGAVARAVNQYGLNGDPESGRYYREGPYKMTTPLILDDLGAEPTLVDYGNRFELLDEILDARWRLWEAVGTLTFLSTNLSDEEIQSRYGVRLWSRIRGMCNIVILHGKDQRLAVPDDL